MEAEIFEAHEIRDRELNEQLEAHALEELDGLSIANQRLATNQAYEEAALLRPEPFAAVIGMGNAYLQRLFEHLGGALLEELDSRAHSIEEIREFGPEIRLLLKLRTCIEVDLAFQSQDAGQQPTALPRSVKGNAFDNTKLATSKRDQLPKRWMANG